MSFQLIQFWQIGLEFEIHVFWISFPTQSPICPMSFRTVKNLACFEKFSVVLKYLLPRCLLVVKDPPAVSLMWEM